MATVDSPPAELVDRSRRLGGDPSLVVFGGGNTSTKAPAVDHFGQPREVLWVKGSGADLATADDGSFAALYLDELVALARLDQLDDAEMVDLVARAMVRPGARRPSIETLLHAFLPFRHVDHVHADAICALTNHPDGRGVVREVFGERFAYVDWIRPGFALSKMVHELAGFDGVVLAHHGLVTWADDSPTCYQRTLDAVELAESFLRGHPMPVAAGEPAPELTEAELRSLLASVRGRLARDRSVVVAVDRRLRAVADRDDAAAVIEAGVSSADHMLWIKPWSCRVPEPTNPSSIVEAIDAFAHRYQTYVQHHSELLPPGFGGHDPLPRVLLVPGVGALTTGSNLQEARMRADIALHTHTVAARVIDTFGAAEPLPAREIFRFDYWPMELDKLRHRPAPAPLTGRVFVVTGAASGIGRTVALHLAELGASLVLGDLDETGLRAVHDEILGARRAHPVMVAGDQRDEEVVLATVRSAVDHFGGLDGAVLGAGIGVTGPLTELSVDRWREALEVNLTSAFLLTKHCLPVLREQGNGGSLVYLASKNAFGPGAGFGAYSVSKAGMVQLMRIAALEGGPDGIRANAVNPDAVFDNSRLWSPRLRAERAAAHGVAEDELEDFYARRNLLHRRVTTRDVAASVAFLLSEESSRTTGSVLPVDGGVASAFPR